MRLSPLFCAAAPLVLASAALVLRTSSQSPVQVTPVAGQVAARWGLLLESERPFYSVGDTLHARFVLTNGSAQDAANWTLASGGNGCNYSFELLDAAGNTVWQPGSVSQGQFVPPPCAFGGRATVLAGHSQVQVRDALPLVYQNADHLGFQGLPLEPGFYQLALEVHQFGPERPPASFEEGLPYGARVPIRIE